MAALFAFKGYAYQVQVYCLLLAIMDCETNVTSIDAEFDAAHNFDDVCLTNTGGDYCFQVKDYPGTSLEEIKLSEQGVLSVKGSCSRIAGDKTSIAVINTDCIPLDECQDVILGLNAKKLKEGVYVVPLSPDVIERKITEMYPSSERISHIISFAHTCCSNGNCKVIRDDLPFVKAFSAILSEGTFDVNHDTAIPEKGVLCIIGKPGVGKSHFVNELVEAYPNAIVYRFWIGSQDPNASDRLEYSEFIRDLCKKVFHSPKEFTEDELIEEINDKTLTLFIDGLDHIENYRCYELDRYFAFVDKLQEARVVVLTRPLRRKISWKRRTLVNWGRSETFKFLVEYKEIDPDAAARIYEIADGYPIITNYLAEHYIIYHEIAVDQKIDSINAYYDSLMQFDGISKALSLFSTNRFYFTYKEIHDLLNHELAAFLVEEFIKKHPYLFEINEKRVSLIHDSLNTYLLGQPNCVVDHSQVIDQIQDSILSREIEYLSRFSGFDFDDDFVAKVLQKYADFDVFKKLLDENYDFESVKEFYWQLKKRFSHMSEKLLDYYQYYAFILICLITERHDFAGSERLWFHITEYWHKHGITIDSIFSTGFIWGAYRARLHKNSQYYRQSYSRTYYDVEKAERDFKKAVTQETTFLNIEELDWGNWESLDQQLHGINLKNTSYEVFYNSHLVAFSYIYIHKISDSPLYEDICKIVSCRGDFAPAHLLAYYRRELYLPEVMCSRLFQELYLTLSSLGYTSEFSDKTLLDVIEDSASQGSFETCERVLAFLRYVNHSDSETDILSVWKYFFMYFNRKDYSVSTMAEALLTFEEVGVIEEKTSPKVLSALMDQSEKGIRLLLNSYLNRKSDVFFVRYFHSVDYDSKHISFFELRPEKLNSLLKEDITKEIRSYLSTYWHSKSIDFYDVKGILLSDYSELFKQALIEREIHITGVPQEYDNIVEGCIYTNASNHDLVDTDDEEFAPFRNGFIHSQDLDYIISQNLSAVEISRYTDEWYSSFPDMALYEHYPAKELARGTKSILHTAMYACIPRSDHFGDWHCFLGNFPRFMKMAELEINWKKLFGIFASFCRCSLIYLPKES